MQIYVDLDGVLADFDALATDIFGCAPREFEAREGSAEFWRRIAAHGSFYRDMPLMADAHRLWAFCCKVGQPVVLTGVPQGDWAAPQKRAWVREHFHHDRVITCTSRRKCEYCQPGDVLIDDMTKYRHLWSNAGGVFITHLSVDSSIAALADYLPSIGR